MKFKITVLIAIFSLLFISCKTTEGKTINGDGTVVIDLSMLFEDVTTADANRIHHLTQNLGLTNYTEIEKYTEDVFIPKGTPILNLAKNEPEFQGFTPAGIIMRNDSDGVMAVYLYYTRNTVTLTFRLSGGKNSHGSSTSTLKGLYGSPLNVIEQLDIGPYYLGSFTRWPSTFPAVDTTYDTAVFAINDFIKEVPSGDTYQRVEIGPSYMIDMGGYEIAAAEVTQVLYFNIMRQNPSHFSGNVRIPSAGEVQDYRPVENISWFDAIKFCNLLSMREGLEPVYVIAGTSNPDQWGEVPEDDESQILGLWMRATAKPDANGFRLPTMAEWKEAAGSGSASWNANNSNARTHEIAKFKPNEKGLYDLSGNVCEWCWDSSAKFLSDISSEEALGTGLYRIQQGGTYYLLESINTSSNSPYQRTSGYGFRLARTTSSQ
ncbi:MAG: SUMF1/EgtB/PvdO family nonheme iron enzyme [Treponema sp.]|nr:SUMF1/EgtB/PvdO family nonheme iron enzyme [Treponema sp.]